MPLDPFFEERLRVHRKYLIDKAVGAVQRRLALLWPFEREHPAADAVKTDASPRERTRAQASSDTRRLAASDPARARARHRRAAVAWDRKELESAGTPGPAVATDEHRIDRDGLPPFRVRIYWPRLAADDAADEPTPAVLAFFGGAFRIGGIDYPTTDAAYRRRALDAGVAIVAVDYALAPEHRYPTAVRQGHAALEWLFERARDLGLDAERVGVAGTSAGAGIAAAVTLLNREGGQRPLRLQLLEVPVVDLTGRHLDLRATRALGIPSLIAVRELRSVARTYLPTKDAAREPHASPLLAASHDGLPPAVILTAEYDPLRGDGDAYGDALRRAGVDASVVRYQGVTHDTAMFTGALPAARRWHADVVTALRRLHE